MTSCISALEAPEKRERNHAPYPPFFFGVPEVFEWKCASRRKAKQEPCSPCGRFLGAPERKHSDEPYDLHCYFLEVRERERKRGAIHPLLLFFRVPKVFSGSVDAQCEEEEREAGERGVYIAP
jgi:hypothetical protein